MKTMTLAILILGLLLFVPTARTESGDDRPTASAPGPLAMIPAHVLPQIEKLALILQRRLADGTLTEAQIQHELQNGDPAGVIRGLGSEAAALLQSIQSSLQSDRSEASLNLMLQSLMGAVNLPAALPALQ